ncbi:hypothetical protein O181_060167 [Austropuccinia psidii MF-1]|uniref:Uncharacterized protein n=1 Tax=Austropuccinia psidii MF-1 TaxID=1389203 RepID=A0A9Q3HY51_9BASI|nr:hypothetical protein [Austropuccinia psidii MF-1]
MGVYGKYILNPFHGQFPISSVLWQIGPFWYFMDFGPYHLLLATYGLRPYPATIGPLGQFYTSSHPGKCLRLGPWGQSGLPGASGASIHHQGLWPKPFHYGV